jgi:hypothetical protein
MIASSGRSSSPRIVSRRFEFSRFQDQMLALAYEALIPVASMCPKRSPARSGDVQRGKTQTDDPRLSALSLRSIIL